MVSRTLAGPTANRPPSSPEPRVRERVREGLAVAGASAAVCTGFTVLILLVMAALG